MTDPHATDPTVLWRLTRGRSTAHATILPGTPQSTIAWFVDGVMDRVENFDSIDIAMVRAELVRSTLLKEGWTETS